MTFQLQKITILRKDCSLLLLVLLTLSFLGLQSIASPPGAPLFSKVTKGAIVTDQGVSFVRSAWVDIDNDGYLDVVVTGWGPGKNAFYLNTGDGTFRSVSGVNPLLDSAYHGGVAAGDYNHDGLPDLFIAAGVQGTSSRCALYRNDGKGVFTSVDGGGVTSQNGFFGPNAWVDYDNDGLLDLFICNLGNASDGGGRNLLWHNNGDSTFALITAGAIVNDVVAGWAPLWSDYNNDGFIDLFLINENSGPNYLYRNNGNGTFTRDLDSTLAEIPWSGGTEGGAWGDFDNDGFPDLFITSSSGSENRLYQNNGDGTFTATAVGLETPAPGGNSVGAVWGDFNNDGYLDLFLSSRDGNYQLFRNNGDGTFAEILSEAPVKEGGPGILGLSVCWVDYDNDGFLDLFVTQASEQGKPITNLLFHNDGKIAGNTNHWLEMKLTGRLSNRSAIGARVRVSANINGKVVTQMREIAGGAGWNSVPLVAHFGLGSATRADLIRIEWPSGVVQSITNSPADQILSVAEHQTLNSAPSPQLISPVLSSTGAVVLSGDGTTGVRYLFESSTNFIDWKWLGVASNANGTISVSDGGATNYQHRFYRALAP